MADHYDTIEAELQHINQNNQIYSENMLKVSKKESYQHPPRDISQFEEHYFQSQRKQKSVTKNKNLIDISTLDEKFEIQRKLKKLKGEHQIQFLFGISENAGDQQIKRRKSDAPKQMFIPLAGMDEKKVFKLFENYSKMCVVQKNIKPGQKIYRDNIQINQKTLKWVHHEYFYSYIDKPYFMQKDFKEILKIFKLDEQKKKKKVEWQIIRQIIGRPRRFSPYFLQKEKEKLDNYRKVLRSYLENPQLKLDIKNPKLIQEAIKLNPFTVGQIVLAIHPVCNHFHNGSIFTTTHTQVIVKFYNELGVHKINDCYIALDSNQDDQLDNNIQKKSQLQQSSQSLNQNQQHIYQQQQPFQSINFLDKNFNLNQPIFKKKHDSKSVNLQNSLQHQQSSSSMQHQQQLQQEQAYIPNFNMSQQSNLGKELNVLSKSSIVQDLDYFSMAFLIKVLERKTALINELRNFNNLAEQNPEISNERFFQEYGWAGVHINLLDNALKHINAKFRLRGIKNYSHFRTFKYFNLIFYCQKIEDLGQICQNFEKILTNPLKDFVEKEIEIENGTEQNQETLKELKSIINKIIEEKISSQINEMMGQYLKKISSHTEIETENLIEKNINDDKKQNFTEEEMKDQNEQEQQQQKKAKHEITIKDNQNQEIKLNSKIEEEQDQDQQQQQKQNEMKIEQQEQQELQLKLLSQNQINEENKTQISEISEQQKQLQSSQPENDIESQKMIKSLVKDDVDFQKTEELKSLVYNCLGVLCTLKQSGEINITENRFIKVLYNTTYEKNSEKFHEINNALLTLTNSKNLDMFESTNINNTNNNNNNNNNNNSTLQKAQEV